MPGSQGTQLCYAETYLYANIPKSTKRSNRETQTSSDCIKKTSA